MAEYVNTQAFYKSYFLYKQMEKLAITPKLQNKNKRHPKGYFTNGVCHKNKKSMLCSSGLFQAEVSTGLTVDWDLNPGLPDENCQDTNNDLHMNC